MTEPRTYGPRAGRARVREATGCQVRRHRRERRQAASAWSGAPGARLVSGTRTRHALGWPRPGGTGGSAAPAERRFRHVPVPVAGVLALSADAPALLHLGRPGAWLSGTDDATFRCASGLTGTRAVRRDAVAMACRSGLGPGVVAAVALASVGCVAPGGAKDSREAGGRRPGPGGRARRRTRGVGVRDLPSVLERTVAPGFPCAAATVPAAAERRAGNDQGGAGCGGGARRGRRHVVRRRLARREPNRATRARWRAETVADCEHPGCSPRLLAPA